MFVPAEMAEVDLFVFEGDAQTVAQTVAQMGIMHLLDANMLGKWSEGVGTVWASRVSIYDNQERRISDLVTRLGVTDLPAECQGRLDPAHDVQAIEQEIQGIDTQARDLLAQEARLGEQLEYWGLVAKSMETLAPLSISLADLRNLDNLHMVAGTMPAENVHRLEESLFRIPYTIIPVHRYGGRVLVFAFCAQEHSPILDRALESAFLQPLQLPDRFEGTPQQVLDQVFASTQEVQAQLDDIVRQRTALATEMAPRLSEVLVRAQRDGAIADAMAHFGHRGRVYLMAGWVRKNRVDELRQAVEEATGGRVTMEENPADTPDHHRVPTLLHNPKMLKPFETLVTTYGIPGYREIDPTPLVALTFVLMFGMMFGDLGHGLVLAVLGAALTWHLLSGLSSAGGFGPILIACGLSSSFFGLLYGSFFGMEGVIPHLWLRPMDNIWTLLGASVVLGVLILNIGFGCRLASAARSGRLAQAIFDKNGLVGLLLYWALLGTALFAALGGGVPKWLLMGIGLLVLLLFGAEPLTRLVNGRRPLVQGSVVELAVLAFFELFEALIGYVSNTLSYVRLGAFAVAHAGLGMVVFLLADMVSSGNATSPMRLAVILLGNIVIIGFEGFIVAIQTLRLEYYELFGKFYQGDGVPFEPLTLPSVEC